MTVYSSNIKRYAIIIISLLLAGGIVYFLRKKPAADKNTSSAAPAAVPPAADTLPAPRTMSRLPDSTRVYLLGNAKIIPHDNYPAHREITLDGDAFFYVPATASAFTIHTKLLTLTIRGKAAFRLTAPSAEEWAEVDVINGMVIAGKAYSSSFNKPDTLHDSQMEMINRTIDLMEKEEFDARALKGWYDKLPR